MTLESSRVSTSQGAPLAHALGVEEVLAELRVSREGLSSGDAEERLQRFGPNVLPAPEPASVLRVILRQFASPLIYILLLAAAVSAAIGDFKDSGFIVFVLALNATIGAVQERRAEQGAQALRSLVVPRAHVVRDRQEYEIAASELVPGDLVVLESGSKVPADLRLTSGTLEVDESLLTGESVPVAKRPDAQVAVDAPLGDRATMAFAGALVTRGRGYGAVVATGVSTELGRIAESLAGADPAPPPLVLRMERFSKRIALAVGVAVVLLGGAALWRGNSLHEVFLGSVTLAVSVIPEGLPVALTVALAIGVHRMSRRRVIVRRLAAVEALGSCTFIASDKTGTLTLNELTVQRVALPGSEPWEVTGEGKSPNGSVLVPEVSRDQEAELRWLERLATAVALCNDASLAHKDGAWTSHGDSVDVALLVLAEKLGMSRAAVESRLPRRGSLPFEAERRFAATVNESSSGLLLAVKGAGERILPMCERMLSLHGEKPLEEAPLDAQVCALAAQGYRVLAVAVGEGRLLSNGEVDPECLQGLTLLGFVGMIDPLRPEAFDAIRACRSAGIEVAMVTGDHPVTALAIASRLGFDAAEASRVTGRALERAAQQGQGALDALVAQKRIFARVEPQQKLQIVESLIRQGHFVAVTGDGANDAPAMRAAHLGVAMGKRGTDVAKEVGELIVTDDNFASIVDGVEEGRVAYANVRKVIYLLVSSGAAELVLFTLAIATGLPLPLLPAQILWLNLVTNGIQDVALAFEPGEGGELRHPPRPPKEPIFDRLMLERTLLAALVMGSVSFGVYQWLLGQGWAVADARNVVLLLMVLFENVQAGNARSERISVLRLSPLRNPLLLFGTLAAQLIHIGAMHTPGVQGILQVQPVSIWMWLSLLGLALTLLVVMEAEKLVRSFKASRARR